MAFGHGGFATDSPRAPHRPEGPRPFGPFFFKSWPTASGGYATGDPPGPGGPIRYAHFIFIWFLLVQSKGKAPFGAFPFSFTRRHIQFTGLVLVSFSFLE